MAAATLGQLADDYEHSLRAFAALLRRIPDGETEVPHLDWNVRETAAHVLSSARQYDVMLDGGPPIWDDVARGAENNARNMETVTERETAALADATVEAAATIAQRVRGLTPGSMIEAWGGITVPIEAAVGVWFGDVQIHGWDLAAAAGEDWRIPTDVAGRSLAGLMVVVPHFVDRDAAAGLQARFGMHYRGQFERTLAFDDGSLVVTDGIDGKVDCHISADPAAFMLVGYGRIGQWGAILRGKLLAYGRKPWLGLQFSKLLRNP